MRHHLFLDFWLADTGFFAAWCHHRAVTCLENVHQSSKRRGNPMGTSSSIRHRFDVEIPRGKFAEITWKLWNRFDVDISTWNRLSKSIKYRWALHVEYSMSLRRQIDVTSVLVVSILSFSNIFCSGNLF